MAKEKQNPTGPGTRQAEDKGEDANHYVVRTHKFTPDKNATEEERVEFEKDNFIVQSLSEEMLQSSAYAHITHEGNQDTAITQALAEDKGSQVLLLCFKNDEPTGMLVGSATSLFGLDYILSLCSALYVRPLDRDGKSAALLMQAFRQWSELREADEIRFLVTSLDNVDKTHDMLTAIDFAYLGGNYAFPLTDKGESVLKPYQPKSGPKAQGKKQ